MGEWMEERYRAVCALSALYKGAAIVVAVGGSLTGLAMLALSLLGIAARGSGLLALAGLTCFAAAQLLDAQLAIEAHTRRLAVLAHPGANTALDDAALRWD
jgi:hypothetical protein